MHSGDYSLRWNKHLVNLFTNLAIFYENKMFSDVTLACDGRMFKAHKLVLAASSPYFERLFREHPADHPIIHLHDASADCMENIMEFMYKGSTLLSDGMVQPFLHLGGSLKLKGLSEGAVSGEDLPPGRQTESQHYDQSQEDLSTTTTAAAPSLVSELEDELPVPESSGAMNASAVDQPVGSGALLNRSSSAAKSKKLRPRRNAIDCVEALMGMDTSSGDGYSSDSHSATLNQFRPHNISNNNNNNGDNNNIRSVKRMRPTLNLTAMVQQENSFERAMDFGTSPPTMVAGFSGYNRPQPRANYELGESSSSRSEYLSGASQILPNDLRIAPNDAQRMGPGHMDIPAVAPGEKWFQGRLQFMLSQRGKPLLVHDGHSFGIQYIRKDKKYWQCNLSRKYNCKARVTTTDTGDIIVTNNEHCHTEIRQHLRKDYKTMKLAASLAASRASFAVSLALPTQSNPAIECTSSTSATNSTIMTANDSHPISTTLGLPDTEQEIRGMNLTRIEQVQRLNS
uniref:BTB domain-containing protein n=1 Tax=Anopheles atroparvus TaxID=41427 RepID=A0A182J986_ANOAO